MKLIFGGFAVLMEVAEPDEADRYFRDREGPPPASLFATTMGTGSIYALLYENNIFRAPILLGKKPNGY